MFPDYFERPADTINLARLGSSYPQSMNITAIVGEKQVHQPVAHHVQKWPRHDTL